MQSRIAPGGVGESVQWRNLPLRLSKERRREEAICSDRQNGAYRRKQTKFDEIDKMNYVQTGEVYHLEALG